MPDLPSALDDDEQDIPLKIEAENLTGTKIKITRIGLAPWFEPGDEEEKG